MAPDCGPAIGDTGPILPGPGSLGRGAGGRPGRLARFFFEFFLKNIFKKKHIFFLENTNQNKKQNPETPPPPPLLPGICRVAMLKGSSHGAPSMAPGGAMFVWPIGWCEAQW